MKVNFMEQKQTKKRRPGYPITVNKNVELVKLRVQNICAEYGISASLLFEAIIDGLTEEDWAKYARIARQGKQAKSRELKRARLIRNGQLKVTDND